MKNYEVAQNCRQKLPINFDELFFRKRDTNLMVDVACVAGFFLDDERASKQPLKLFLEVKIIIP